MSDPVRVLLVDDHGLFRSGLARLLDAHPAVTVVGQAADGNHALELCDTTVPDVVLMDLRMPGIDGVSATRAITERHPEIKVLVLTGFEADTYAIEAMRSGASGYLLKDSQPEALVSSIVAVRSGERVMAKSVASRMLAMISGEQPGDLYDGLTLRELQILTLLASGAPNKQIAFRMHLSEKTVRNHISHIYEKLGISDRSQAVLYAVRKGLIGA